MRSAPAHDENTRALIEERKRLGIDRFDEVHRGVYVMNAAPRRRHGAVQLRVANHLQPLAAANGLWCNLPTNIGELDDFRAPDVVLLPYDPEEDDRGLDAFGEDSPFVVEVEDGPLDPVRRADLGAHGVAEILVVDYLKRTVQLLDATTGAVLTHSFVLDLPAAHLHPWPA